MKLPAVAEALVAADATRRQVALAAAAGLVILQARGGTVHVGTAAVAAAGAARGYDLADGDLLVLFVLDAAADAIWHVAAAACQLWIGQYTMRWS